MRYTTTSLTTISTLLAVVSGNAIRFYNSRGGCTNTYASCENAGPNVCCYVNSPRWSVSISKGPADIGIGWFEEDNNNCADPVCTAGGSGTICCAGFGINPRYTGGSFYTVGGRMRRGEAERCTESREADVFGLDLGGGEFLQVSMAEVAANGRSAASFEDLFAAFQDLEPAEAKAFLEKNGALIVKDEVVTQTITVDEPEAKREAEAETKGKGKA